MARPRSSPARSTITALLALAVLLNACQSQAAALSPGLPADGLQPISAAGTPEPATPQPTEELPTPFPTRPLYAPAELVDYTAQSGDTLPALTVRFNTTLEEILQANSFIPANATTMPPGMPMKIPIYYLPFWGSPYRILPDSYFVNGPTQIGFDTSAFVASQPGWLKDYSSYVAEKQRSGAEIVDFIARDYSVSPRLLLALLEYQAGALSQPSLPPEKADYPLGYRQWDYKGVYMQLHWAANLLNDGFYQWRQAKITSLEHRDGRVTRFDPWQNAATVSLHQYFNILLDYTGFLKATGPEGFAQTYRALFGDPWQDEQPHIPGSLVQPEFILPFQPGDTWAYTGGPHTGWGRSEPYAAIDFAPPSVAAGCEPSSVWATAVAAGLVVRSETGQVMLDLDGDGDERTGWNIFYLHIGTEGRAPMGAQLERGEPIGHPSCEGGRSTGTHIHIARKYNGEWIQAEGVLAFNLEGWIAFNGRAAYLGTLVRGNRTVTANVNSNQATFIQSDQP